MIISLAQVAPKYGDISHNIATQETFIREAADKGAKLIVFPELSLTGYEPLIAKDLATTAEDDRFEIFQLLADQKQITILTGVPLRSDHGITVSLLIYQPDLPMQVYHKQYLPADEVPYFVSEPSAYTFGFETRIGLAICYELSEDAHFESCLDQGLDLYLASTAKTAQGSEKAHMRLEKLASDHQIITTFVNSVGPANGEVTNGRSAAWDHRGEMLGELSTDKEGILILDTVKQALVNITEVP